MTGRIEEVLGEDFLQIGLGDGQALLAQHRVGGTTGDAGHGGIQRRRGDTDDDDGDHQLDQGHAALAVHGTNPVTASTRTAWPAPRVTLTAWLGRPRESKSTLKAADSVMPVGGVPA
ncbi:hypothetical protein D3C81_1783230 [compost metagenome]